MGDKVEIEDMTTRRWITMLSLIALLI